LAFFARKCSWTKEYIFDNLTFEQLYKYYEEMQNVEMEDLFYQTTAMVQAHGHVTGVIDKNSYKKFCDALLRVKKAEPVFNRIKSMNGIEVQDD